MISESIISILIDAARPIFINPNIINKNNTKIIFNYIYYIRKKYIDRIPLFLP